MSKHGVDDRGASQAAAQYDSIKEMVDALCKHDSRDDVEQRIHDDPLSVQVRGGWYSPGDSDKGGSPEEYEILLATGGPAARLIGDLDEFGGPETALMQHQDWGTPWLDWAPHFQGDIDAIVAQMDEMRETLLAYARCFYFGK